MNLTFQDLEAAGGEEELPPGALLQAHEHLSRTHGHAFAQQALGLEQRGGKIRRKRRGNPADEHIRETHHAKRGLIFFTRVVANHTNQTKAPNGTNTTCINPISLTDLYINGFPLEDSAFGGARPGWLALLVTVLVTLLAIGGAGSSG